MHLCTMLTAELIWALPIYHIRIGSINNKDTQNTCNPVIGYALQLMPEHHVVMPAVETCRASFHTGELTSLFHAGKVHHLRYNHKQSADYRKECRISKPNEDPSFVQLLRCRFEQSLPHPFGHYFLLSAYNLIVDLSHLVKPYAFCDCQLHFPRIAGQVQ